MHHPRTPGRPPSGFLQASSVNILPNMNSVQDLHNFPLLLASRRLMPLLLSPTTLVFIIPMVKNFLLLIRITIMNWLKVML